jgi:predicted nucleotidyltransferase component of viral defense system
LIAKKYLEAWAKIAPWADERQVEQDLIICRALCDLFNSPALKGRIAFRGGTAINKLLFSEPLRYSEDIDLVQTKPEPIGQTIDAIREALAWLGVPARKVAAHSLHLNYRFNPEAAPDERLLLKVEMNTREHANLMGLREMPFKMQSEWYSGSCEISTFAPEELFGTKLRALLQRRKNRDLFDLHHGLESLNLDERKVIKAFDHYLDLEGTTITRAHAEERMLKKLIASLTDDIGPLLPVGSRFEEADALGAFENVWRKVIAHLPGDAWKRTSDVLEEFRARKFPGLLEGV